MDAEPIGLEALVGSQLRDRPAVVLERIARGGGATNWWYLRRPPDLDEVLSRVRPGSVVSFYFDGRMPVLPLDEETPQQIGAILDRAGECVVGWVVPGTAAVEVDFLTTRAEVAEFICSAPADAELLFGPFPARDNDGVNAFTVTLPDADGVVRAHPH